jgi:hypothetical protein
MKRAVLLATLAVFALPAAALRADEPAETHLEFVRKLRDKGYADLAMQHLEKLQKAPPPGLAAQLPIEMARTRVSLARDREPAQRGVLFEQARKELQDFIARNPQSPELTQARLELARLAALQGQALLSQSIRQDDDKVARELAQKAEKFFQQAGAELKAAADALPKPEDKIQVLFERGKNFLDQAETHPKDRARATLVGDAITALQQVEKIALGTDKLPKPTKTGNRNPGLHLARAWLVKALQEATTSDLAAEYFKAVMEEEVPQAQPGQRWAWYFHISYLPRNPKVKLSPLAVLKLQQKDARAWLKAYPRHANSPEGYAVRFELANALLKEAQGISKDANSPKAAALYTQAQKELAALAASDSDYTEKAAQLNLALSFQKMGPKTPVADLKDFDQCYLKARYEVSKMEEAAARQEARQQHLRTAIAAFRRGLQLADGKTSFAKLADARYYLTYAYLMAGDPYRAAVVGEDLARAQPPTKRSAAAAGYALEAYSTIAANTRRPGDVERMRDLARFILEDKGAAWKDEPVVQVARHQLATAAILAKKPLEAINLLEQLSPSYPAYVYAQSQLVLTAVGALRKDKEALDPKDKLDPKARKLLLSKAQAALDRLPPLPDGADPTTAQFYFAAKLEKGNALYGDAFEHSRKSEAAAALKSYAALDKFQAELKQQYEKHAKRFSPEAQEQFAAALKRLQNLARYGIVQGEYRAGRYDAVLAPKAAGEVVAQVRKLAGKDGGAIHVPDARLTGEILGLAMRASVQKGKVAEARDILGLLRRLAGNDRDGAGDQTGATLQTLVLELKAQIRELKDKQQKKQLEATVKNFSQFLEELAKEPGYKDSKESIVFLASTYASLEKYAEAAKLYAQIPVPKIDPKKAKLTPEEDRQLQDYWMMQVAYGRALRLAKQYPEARKVLTRILTDPKARGRFLAEKEDIHLLEDQGLYGTAVGRWVKYQQHPQMQLALKTIGSKDPAEQKRIKELYYDCVYQYTYCMYMYGKNHKVEAKRDDYVKRAAAKVIQMEKNADAWEVIGDKFRALLRQEPLLMAEYERQKGKAAAK